MVHFFLLESVSFLGHTVLFWYMSNCSGVPHFILISTMLLLKKKKKKSPAHSLSRSLGNLHGARSTSKDRRDICWVVYFQVFYLNTVLSCILSLGFTPSELWKLRDTSAHTPYFGSSLFGYQLTKLPCSQWTCLEAGPLDDISLRKELP